MYTVMKTAKLSLMAAQKLTNRGAIMKMVAIAALPF